MSSDKNISSQYAVNVFNRFQELSSSLHLESDNIDSIYNNLIVANEEVALSTLPKKLKSRKNPISADVLVSSARENLRKTASLYHSNPSRPNKVKLAASKRVLDEAYLDAEAAFVNGKINELAYLHINNQHSAAWKTVNELSGKSSKPPTTLKGGCREKRLENWLSHFKNLLGKPATLPENKTLPRLQVCNSLNQYFNWGIYYCRIDSGFERCEK